jgi:hypothetical protein
MADRETLHVVVDARTGQQDFWRPGAQLENSPFVYQAELSAMNRLMEFTVPVEQPKGPATADQKRSQRERESRIPMVWPVAIPAPCNLVVEWGRPKPIPPDPAATLLLEAVPFAGPIQFP